MSERITPTGLSVIENNIIVPQRQVKIYDTTLRDGAQHTGAVFSAKGKLRVARQLNETLPVDIIEGGWPGPGRPTDTRFFEMAQDEAFHDKLAAFGMTRKPNSHVETDGVVNGLIDSKAPIVTFVGKTEIDQIRLALKTTPEENLNMIRESVAYAREQGRRVIYDAEHFFDGAIKDRDYAMATLYAAAAGGAEAIALCDTNGGRNHRQIGEWVTQVVNDKKLHEIFRKANDLTDPQAKIEIGIHTHSDKRKAEASALEAAWAGASHIQGTSGGLGERAGNADLFVVIDDLHEEGLIDVTEEQLAGFTSLARTIYEAAGLKLNPNQPIVGEDVFGTQSGMHQAAMIEDPKLYTFKAPERFGNDWDLFLSGQSGKAAVENQMEKLGLNVDKDIVYAVTNSIKNREDEGYRFIGSEATTEMLMRRLDPNYAAPFNVSFEESKEVEPKSVTIKIADRTEEIELFGKNGNSHKATIESVFDSLKSELVENYPELNGLHIDNAYPDGENGTRRVFMRVVNGIDIIKTMGASNSSIAAAIKASTDAIEYAILHPKKSSEE